MTSILKEPVPLWIVARLFDEPHRLTSQELLKSLCAASFKSMHGDEIDVFEKSLDRLIELEYICDASTTLTQFNALVNRSDASLYRISKKGIVAYRREIDPIAQKIKKHPDKLRAIKDANPVHKKMIEVILNNADYMIALTKEIVKNAPAFLALGGELLNI